MQIKKRRLNRRNAVWSTPALVLALFVSFWQLGLTGAQAQTPYAKQYTDFAIESTRRVEGKIPEITRLAEVMAKRHLAGGAIGFVGGYYEGSGMRSELEGRSGGLINIGFDRVWTKDRTAEQKANDMAIAGWDSGPWPGDADLTKIKKLKEAGTYIIGFGPRNAPELAERVALCDAWLDSGLDVNGRVVMTNLKRIDSMRFKAGTAGRGNLLVNMLNGWALTGEFVSALTRQGKMPPMWKSFMYPDGGEWANKYFQKVQFHDDFTIAPIPAGQLAKAYLANIRTNINWFAGSQFPAVQKAADMIVNELSEFRQTVVPSAGHAPPTFAGKYEDKIWATSFEINTPEEYEKRTPDNALILRLGYTGISAEELTLAGQKKQRVIWISSQSPVEGKQVPANLPNFIDMGWAYGDAALSIEGYPIKILPPSGIMQIVAYEAINTEVLARISQRLSTASTSVRPSTKGR